MKHLYNTWLEPNRMGATPLARSLDAPKYPLPLFRSTAIVERTKIFAIYSSQQLNRVLHLDHVATQALHLPLGVRVDILLVGDEDAQVHQPRGVGELGEDL